MKQFVLSFLFFFVLANGYAISQDTILLQDNATQVSSDDKELFFFTKKEVPIEQLMHEPFKPKKEIDVAYITGFLWVKFIIKNNSNTKRFVLHPSDGHIAGLFMYKPTPAGYQMTTAGRYHPEDGREVYNRIPAFFLDLEKGETKTFYLKIKTMNEVVNFRYIIQDYPNYTRSAQTDYLIIGLYFGALLLIIVVNIFYFVSLKDSIFLIYALYVLGSFLFSATLNGFTWLLIPADAAYHACYFCLRFWPDTLLFFTIHLVNLKQHRRKLYNFACGFILYHTIGMAVLEYLNVYNIQETIMAQWETINWGLSILLIFIIILLSYKNNKYLFKYYIIAYGILLLIFVFLTKHAVGAENWLLFEHGVKAGTLIEMITFSFAVSRRFKLTENDLKRKKEEEQLLNDKVQQLETEVRKAQMNPHFMFNALTSIEYFILKNDSKQARSYLGKFSRLMRLTLDHSRNNFVPLQDELVALKIYVELEFLRLNNEGHTFEIKTDETTEQADILVPPLLIQPFVENAIWHGLQRSKQKGNLLIDVRLINDELRCTVEDNGIGIKNEIVPKNHKSSGMLITKERLTLIHALLNTVYKFAIEDLGNEKENSTGTRVKFNMPYVAGEF